jgi:uncharacterized protein YceK
MIKGVVLPIAVAMLAGCASQSSRVDSTPAAAAVAPAVASDAAIPTATLDASATGAATDGPPAGWQTKLRVGETVYCRKVKITGTRYPQEVCLKPGEVDAALRAQKTQTQQRTRPMSESIEIED